MEHGHDSAGTDGFLGQPSSEAHLSAMWFTLLVLAVCGHACFAQAASDRSGGITKQYRARFCRAFARGCQDLDGSSHAWLSVMLSQTRTSKGLYVI